MLPQTDHFVMSQSTIKGNHFEIDVGHTRFNNFKCLISKVINKRIQMTKEAKYEDFLSHSRLFFFSNENLASQDEIGVSQVEKAHGLAGQKDIKIWAVQLSRLGKFGQMKTCHNLTTIKENQSFY